MQITPICKELQITDRGMPRGAGSHTEAGRRGREKCKTASRCVIPILPHTFIPRQKQAWWGTDVAELPLLPPKAYTSCLQVHSDICQVSKPLGERRERNHCPKVRHAKMSISDRQDGRRNCTEIWDHHTEAHSHFSRLFPSKVSEVYTSRW